MKNRKVAITGGAGFIGANLANELVANNRIIIIDNLPEARTESINGLLASALTFSRRKSESCLAHEGGK
jgi:nucleoside-diphosphate-sugar epimerase